jgi:hypothetical protein
MKRNVTFHPLTKFENNSVLCGVCYHKKFHKVKRDFFKCKVCGGIACEMCIYADKTCLSCNVKEFYDKLFG